MSLIRRAHLLCLTFLFIAALAAPALAQSSEPAHRGGEVNLVVPDLNAVSFLNGIGGRTLLMSGLLVSALGLLFALIIYKKLRNLRGHSSMLEISELGYETCKTYLLT